MYRVLTSNQQLSGWVLADAVAAPQSAAAFSVATAARPQQRRMRNASLRTGATMHCHCACDAFECLTSHTGTGLDLHRQLAYAAVSSHRLLSRGKSAIAPHLEAADRALAVCCCWLIAGALHKDASI
jgi:hypothetical protein